MDASLCKRLVATAQIHWFSLMNSFMLVLFLIGVVAVILTRTLRKDFARYNKDEALDDLVWESYLVPSLPGVVGQSCISCRVFGSAIRNVGQTCSTSNGNAVPQPA
jgi:hypothetical protein